MSFRINKALRCVGVLVLTAGGGVAASLATSGPAGATTVAGHKCTIVGTAGDDVLRGTSHHDVICGLGGDDTLIGNGGDDRLIGGKGRDHLRGGNGNDTENGGREATTSGVDRAVITSTVVPATTGWTAARAPTTSRAARAPAPSSPIVTITKPRTATTHRGPGGAAPMAGHDAGDHEPRTGVAAMPRRFSRLSLGGLDEEHRVARRDGGELVVRRVGADAVEEHADFHLPVAQVVAEDVDLVGVGTLPRNASTRRPTRSSPVPAARRLRTHCVRPRGATR